MKQKTGIHNISQILLFKCQSLVEELKTNQQTLLKHTFFKEQIKTIQYRQSLSSQYNKCPIIQHCCSESFVYEFRHSLCKGQYNFRKSYINKSYSWNLINLNIKKQDFNTSIKKRMLTILGVSAGNIENIPDQKGRF